MINLVRILSILVITILTYLFINSLIKHNTINKQINKMLNKNNECDKAYFSYRRIEDFLKRSGSTTTPIEFIAYKIFFSLIFIFIGFKSKGIMGAIIGCIIGFFLLDILIYIQNYYENKRIILDMCNVQDCLRIQRVGGVSLIDALCECYLIAKNKRVKKALAELNSELIINKNIELAIDSFNSKFNSTYIDSFCITIKQSSKSGKAGSALDDLATEVKDGREIEDDERIERSELIYDFNLIMILAGECMIIMYAMLNSIQKLFYLF